MLTDQVVGGGGGGDTRDDSAEILFQSFLREASASSSGTAYTCFIGYCGKQFNMLRHKNNTEENRDTEKQKRP